MSHFETLHRRAGLNKKGTSVVGTPFLLLLLGLAAMSVGSFLGLSL